MTLVESAPEVDRPGSRSTIMPVLKTRRSLRDRLTLNVVAGLLAGLLAFVVVSAVLRDRREMVSIAVAKERIPAGVTITPAMVTEQELPASVGFSSGLVPYSDIANGVVAARTVQPGEAIPTSATGEPANSGARDVGSGRVLAGSGRRGPGR
ncbi:MAG: SAF domain-containing protein [Ilumatobacteraceae bacterium]